ncbi:MAG: PEP-CTERM sorting domain-containing protein [Verrucomicrobiota bacterium]
MEFGLAAGPGASGTGTTNTETATFSNGGGTTQAITDSAINRNLGTIAYTNTVTGSGGLGNFTIGSGSDTLYLHDFNNSSTANISETGTSNSSLNETIASNIMATGANGTSANDVRISTANGFAGTINLSGTLSTVATGATSISDFKIVTSGTDTIPQTSNVVELSGLIQDSQSGGAKVSVTHARDGVVLVTNGNSTYSGGYTQGNNDDDLNSITELGASSTGPDGAPTSGPLGTGTFSLDGGTIESDGTTARTIANNWITTGNGSSSLTWVSTSSVYGFGDATNNGTLTFTGAGTLGGFAGNAVIVNSTTIWSGNVGGTNVGNLLKGGTGTLVLSGKNTYYGGSTVAAGALVLGANGGSSVTGTGSLSVAQGATLAGTGVSAGTATGAHFTIGGTTGTGQATVLVGHTSATDLNTTSTMTLTAVAASTIENANLSFNLDTTTPGSGNQLAVGATAIAFGNGSVGVAPVTLTLNLQGSSIIAPDTAYVLIAGNVGVGDHITQFSGLDLATDPADIVTLSDGATETRILNSNFGGSGNLTVSFGAQNGYYGENSYLFLYQDASTGADNIEVEVVPEPGTWALMLGGFTMLMFWQRRRRN